MTTIELPSGMTLPRGTRHAGLARLSAGASLVRRLLVGAGRVLASRRTEAAAADRVARCADIPGARPRYDLYAGLPRGLGD